MKKLILSLLLSLCAWGASAAEPIATTNKFAGEYFGVPLSTATNAERVLIDVLIYTNNTVEIGVLSYDFSILEVGYGTNTARGKFYAVFPESGYVLSGVVGKHKVTGLLKPVIPGQGRYTFTAWRRYKFPYAPADVFEEVE